MGLALLLTPEGRTEAQPADDLVESLSEGQWYRVHPRRNSFRYALDHNEVHIWEGNCVAYVFADHVFYCRDACIESNGSVAHGLAHYRFTPLDAAAVPPGSEVALASLLQPPSAWAHLRQRVLCPADAHHGPHT